jgi:hypothetical protein
MQSAQHRFHYESVDLVARDDIRNREGTVRPRVTANYFRQRVGRLLEKYFRETGRQWRSERIAVAARIFHGNGAGFAGNAHSHRAACIEQFLQHGGDLRAGTPRENFVVGKISKFQQQVMKSIDVARLIIGFQCLQFRFDFIEGRGI